MNQFVELVMDVARLRIFMEKISGGYTQATQAQVMAKKNTYMYTNAMVAFDAEGVTKLKLVFLVISSK